MIRLHKTNLNTAKIKFLGDSLLELNYLFLIKIDNSWEEEPVKFDTWEEGELLKKIDREWNESQIIGFLI